MTPLRIFIGFDAHETVAYHVLAHSILEHATIPVAITPLRSHTIPAFVRPRSATQATDFSFTRFLVPWLCGFDGPAVFMDCDMLVQADVRGLLEALAQQPRASVLVCPHDYTPKDAVKFLGNSQKAYPRKNWSSLMVFRTDRCQALTPDYVNDAPAANLHRLSWVGDDCVGALPLSWNWLVGEYPPKDDAECLHWTVGGPWFPEYLHTDHAERWLAARDRMLVAG